MSAIKKIAVLGGGSFGTVLANIAASNGYDVSLWVRDSDQALRINSEGANTTYHPELQLSSNIEASEKLDSVIKDANIVLIACLLYTSPSPRDGLLSRMPSSA